MLHDVNLTVESDEPQPACATQPLDDIMITSPPVPAACLSYTKSSLIFTLRRVEELERRERIMLEVEAWDVEEEEDEQS